MSDEGKATQPDTSTTPQAPAEGRDALVASGGREFSEQRGINIVNLAPVSGAVPEPGGLPAATGTPVDARPAPPSAPAESAPPNPE